MRSVSVSGYTSIRHNYCLILWKFHLCSQDSSDLWRHGLKTSEGVLWCLAPEPFTGAPLGPLCLVVGPPWIRPALHVLQMLDQIYCVPQSVAEQCLLCVRAHCPAGGGGPLPLGSAAVMTDWGFVFLLCSTLCTNVRAGNHQTLWSDSLRACFYLALKCVFGDPSGQLSACISMSAYDQLSLSSCICK